MKRCKPSVASGLLVGALAFGLHSRASIAAEHGHGDGGHKAAGEKHAHKSPHGGIVKTIGKYHAELVFHPKHIASYACPMKCEKGKTYSKPGKCPVCHMALKGHETGRLELYVLGADEKSAVPIKAKSPLIVQVQIKGRFHGVPLEAAPLKGEKKGASSHFVGTSDVLRAAKAFDVYAQIRVGWRKNYRVVFHVKTKESHKGHEKSQAQEGHSSPGSEKGSEPHGHGDDRGKDGGVKKGATDAHGHDGHGAGHDPHGH